MPDRTLDDDTEWAKFVVRANRMEFATTAERNCWENFQRLFARYTKESHRVRELLEGLRGCVRVIDGFGAIFPTNTKDIPEYVEALRLLAKRGERDAG